MTSRWGWFFAKVARRIWFRATLFSILAVATALVAIFVSPYIPSDLPTQIGADAVDNILGIIASSMLTVTTFSLSTMVSAYSAAMPIARDGAALVEVCLRFQKALGILARFDQPSFRDNAPRKPLRVPNWH